VKIIFTTFILLFFLVVALVFGSQNTDPILLNYLVAKTEITVAYAVSIFTFIGFILGLLFSLLWKLVSTVKSKNVR